MPGTEGTVPFGISVPGGTPASVVMRLNTAFNEAHGRSADAPASCSNSASSRSAARRRHYAAVLASEIAKWRKVIKESKIPPPS